MACTEDWSDGVSNVINAEVMQRLREERERAKIEQEVIRKRALIESYGEDLFSPGEVISFTRQVYGRTYSYAAIKVVTDVHVVQWWVTGRETEPKSWEELTFWLATGDCPMITSMIPLMKE